MSRRVCGAEGSFATFSVGVLAAVAAGGCGASAVPVTSPPSTHPEWSYSAAGGPARWGELDPAYALCKTGAAQSPIDLPTSVARHEAAPARPRWDPMPLRLANTGHTIQVTDTAASSLVLGGTTYRLAQFHVHAPSDHTIGGHRYAAEMHLVHKSEAGRLLVVAILFESGAENATLANAWSNVPERGAAPVDAPGTTLDLGALLPTAPRYLRYEGSLTTPPCAEGVTWLVVEPDGTAQLSPAQIGMLRERTEASTSRPTQPQGAREVVELVP